MSLDFDPGRHAVYTPEQKFRVQHRYQIVADENGQERADLFTVWKRIRGEWRYEATILLHDDLHRAKWVRNPDTDEWADALGRARQHADTARSLGLWNRPVQSEPATNIFYDQHGARWEYSSVTDPAWGPAFSFLPGLTNQLRYLGTIRKLDNDTGQDIAICQYIHATTYRRINLDEHGRAWNIDQQVNSDQLTIHETDLAEARAQLTQPQEKGHA